MGPSRVLFRRVYDASEGEIQLRVAVPTGGTSSMEVPGVGRRDLSLRNRLLLEYHNGVLGGHLGRDKTYARLERDWWWPGLYRDVMLWCKHCLPCQKENSRTGVSAWSRTEYYDRPFRVIQFDLVTCGSEGINEGGVTGARYILTSICCFSRWVWFVPLINKEAETVAKALLEKVLIGLAMFPTVLRSDNDPVFTSELFACMNRMLNIHHIFGSTYHPQSQGLIENIHRTMTSILKQLIEEHPNEWENMLPFAECIVRITPVEALGNRSPYQIVTGLQPKLPRTLIGDGRVVSIGSDEYVVKLLEYLRGCYRSVFNQTKALREADEMTGELRGSPTAELQVGDLVVIRFDSANRPKGTKRFQSKVRPDYWRIKTKISPHAFKLCNADDESIEHPFSQNAEHLVKIELPELDFDRTRRRVVEVSNQATGRWDRFRIEKFSVDGRCFVRKLTPKPGAHFILTEYDEAPHGEWMDLSKHIYRWISQVC